MIIGRAEESDTAPMVDSDVGRPAAPASGYWSIYLMGVAVLLATGAGAGQLAYRLGDPGSALGVIQCWLNSGIDPNRLGNGGYPNGVSPSAFDACFQDHGRRLGLAGLAGAAAALAAVWLLMLAGGLRTRRRLRRHGSVGYDSPALADVRQRFTYWCDLTGLQGRRRPRLLLARPGSLAPQAHTTALPFARPMVVIPAAYAYTHRSQLDLAILHELAHVRARDVTWASATEWAGWLNLPILLFGFMPLLLDPQRLPPDYLNSLYLAVLLSAVILILRAAVLRRRERSADRYAGEMLGGLDTLAAADRPATPTRVAPVRQLLGTVRRWTAVHPSAGTRVQAAAVPADGWERGFTLAAVTGLLAMFIYQTLYSTLLDLAVPSGGGVPLMEVCLIGAGLLWATILIPAWARSGLPIVGFAPRCTQWSPILGSALGLTAGFFLRSPGSIEVLSRGLYPGGLPLAVGWFLIVAFGVSVLAAGLASSVTAGPRAPTRTRNLVPTRRTVAITAAVIGATATATAAFLACLLDLKGPGATNPALLRSLMLFPGVGRASNWYPLLLLITAAVISLAGPAGSGRWGRLLAPGLGRVVAVAALSGATIAVVTTQLRLTGGVSALDDVNRLMMQRFWVCGACGAMAMMVLLLVSTATFTQILMAGAIVAEVVGLAQVTSNVVTDTPGWNILTVVDFLRLPLWLLCLTLVVTLPAVLLARDAVLLLRRGPLTVRPLTTVVTTSTAVCAAGLAVMTGLVSTVTVARGDYHQAFDAASAAAAARPALPASAPTPAGIAASPTVAGTADPGRALTGAQATAVLRDMHRALPDWTLASNTAEVYKDVQPYSCAAVFEQRDDTDRARARSGEATRTLTLSEEQMPPVGAAITVRLTSYRTAQVAAAALLDSERQAKACPRWNVQIKYARQYYSWGPNRRLDLPISSRAQWLEGRVTYRKVSYITDVAYGRAVIGHNLVFVTVMHPFIGATNMPKDRVALLQSWRQQTLSETLAGLERE